MNYCYIMHKAKFTKTKCKSVKQHTTIKRCKINDQNATLYIYKAGTRL